MTFKRKSFDTQTKTGHYEILNWSKPIGNIVMALQPGYIGNRPLDYKGKKNQFKTELMPKMTLSLGKIKELQWEDGERETVIEENKIKSALEDLYKLINKDFLRQIHGHK